MNNAIPENGGLANIGRARRPRQAAFLAVLSLLLLAGCSGGKEEAVPSDSVGESPVPAATAPRLVPPRKEFVLVRELIRQHELQQGNAKRIEVVETALKERVPLLPDEGKTEEETSIFQQAKRLLQDI